MSRRGSLAALGLCLALVLGSAVALAGGVAMGAWQPAGPPRATPGPTAFPGMAAIESFLDEVRAGLVIAVFQRGAELAVHGVDRDYVIALPSETFDIYGPMEAAARDGGVPIPEITMEGEPPTVLTYPEFLEQVRSGTFEEIQQVGDLITAYRQGEAYQVEVPAGTDNVLADIENAAAEGGVMAPYYAKAPGEPVETPATPE